MRAAILFVSGGTSGACASHLFAAVLESIRQDEQLTIDLTGIGRIDDRAATLLLAAEVGAARAGKSVCFSGLSVADQMTYGFSSLPHHGQG